MIGSAWLPLRHFNSGPTWFKVRSRARGPGFSPPPRRGSHQSSFKQCKSGSGRLWDTLQCPTVTPLRCLLVSVWVPASLAKEKPLRFSSSKIWECRVDVGSHLWGAYRDVQVLIFCSSSPFHRATRQFLEGYWRSRSIVPPPWPLCENTCPASIQAEDKICPLPPAGVHQTLSPRALTEGAIILSSPWWPASPGTGFPTWLTAP